MLTGDLVAEREAAVNGPADQQLDCYCTVINLHYQPEGTLQEFRGRLHASAALWPAYPDGVGFLVGDFSI